VKDLFAIEVYQPSDVPPEYQHLNWQGKPCTLVMMWSMGEAQRQLRRLGTPK
jgi:hypothetical protein